MDKQLASGPRPDRRSVPARYGLCVSCGSTRTIRPEPRLGGTAICARCSAHIRFTREPRK